jgi:predicted SnoaL-like aldol condensation-catalyzing enzyme
MNTKQAVTQLIESTIHSAIPEIAAGVLVKFMRVSILVCALMIFAQPIRADDTLTARNKEIVRNFYTTVLIGRDVDAAPRFLRPDYIQHNPQVPTGLKGFMDAFRARFAQPLPPDYKRELLNVISEKDMVVIYVRQTWTGKDGQHHQALGFDMFRVQDGLIAEHWDAD